VVDRAKLLQIIAQKLRFYQVVILFQLVKQVERRHNFPFLG